MGSLCAIPYMNEKPNSERAQHYLYDAGPEDLIRTFHLPSGKSGI